MAYNYLILQATYHDIQCALYIKNNYVDRFSLDKFKASAFLMDSLCNMLQAHNLDFKKLDFMGSSQGPAPFTTLRTLLTTLNGISFATKVPLIGCDGLALLVQEHYKKDNAIALLNAFSGDLYYAFYDGVKVQMGCNKLEHVFEEIQKQFSKKTITFVGNGVPEEYRKDAKIIEMVSLEYIAQYCLDQWSKGYEKVFHIAPLHMKTMDYKKA